MERSAVNAADGGSHDSEEYIQPENEARVDAANLGSSQPAGTEIMSQPAKETASTSSAGMENRSEVLNSQPSYKRDDMDFGSESDMVSEYR